MTMPKTGPYRFALLLILLLGPAAEITWVAICHFIPLLRGPIFVIGVLLICTGTGYLLAVRKRAISPSVWEQIGFSAVVGECCAMLAFPAAGLFDGYHSAIFADRGPVMSIFLPILLGMIAGAFGVLIGLASQSKRPVFQPQ